MPLPLLAWLHLESFRSLKLPIPAAPFRFCPDALLCFPAPLSRCTALLSALRSTAAAVLEGEEGAAARLGSRRAATSPGGGAECIGAGELQLLVPLPLTWQQVGGNTSPSPSLSLSLSLSLSRYLPPAHSFSFDFCHRSPWISLFSRPDHSNAAHHKRFGTIRMPTFFGRLVCNCKADATQI